MIILLYKLKPNLVENMTCLLSKWNSVDTFINTVLHHLLFLTSWPKWLGRNFNHIPPLFWEGKWKRKFIQPMQLLLTCHQHRRLWSALGHKWFLQKLFFGLSYTHFHLNHHFCSFCRLGISYVCVTHHEESGFNVYRGKGHPSNETKKRLSDPTAMKADIDKLRKELKY